MKIYTAIIVTLLAVIVLPPAYEDYQAEQREDRIQTCVDALADITKEAYDWDNDGAMGQQMKETLFESWNNTCTEQEGES